MRKLRRQATLHPGFSVPAWWLVIAWAIGPIASGRAAETRQWIELGTGWQFQTNGAPATRWKPVTLPSEFEAHEGLGFDGVGWYRRTLPAIAPKAGRRWLLHFQAAATHAQVWLNETELGSHLGGWTPFRLDLTDSLRPVCRGDARQLRVCLDERVGHNTQGFLPVVQPHFGGVWQKVGLLEVPATYIDDLRVRAIGIPETSRLELEVPVCGDAADAVDRLWVSWRLRGTLTGAERWLRVQPGTRPASDSDGSLRREGDRLVAVLPMANPALWSPETPSLYEVEIGLPADGSTGTVGDRVRARAAFRTIRAEGDHLWLNGRPLSVRGLLNWGYYPPGLAPNPKTQVFRRDLEFARAQGFNLMKCCLWVPPKSFLEAADELGVLVWMEYPTWHPRLTPEFQAPLRQEFAEFFAYDRNHPSVILRSLTCETGPGADLEVIRSLYDLAHRMIPGAVVEDDSSWIEWNRITDFFDDHPYGNNHTWVATLERLREYAAQHGPKPLVLGEAIAADTWVPLRDLTKRIGLGHPYWAPKGLEAQRAWVSQMGPRLGAQGLARLEPDSLRYAWLMRKYQIETFRREVPAGGYVVSVIRDFPLASMGLLDYLGRPKWPKEDWAWHGDTMCLMQTTHDARSFRAGETLRASLWLSHFGPGLLGAVEGTVRLEPAARERGAAPPRMERLRAAGPASGSLVELSRVEFPLPSVDRPSPWRIKVDLRAGRRWVRNEWPIWLVPPEDPQSPAAVTFQDSVPAELRAALAVEEAPMTRTVKVATRFDAELVEYLEQGGRVLMLPDGNKGSFRLAPHWFLRGAPWVGDQALAGSVPGDLWVELQHFDLASEVLPELGFVDQIDPILMLWDTHDHGSVKTHGLVFETRVRRGRLMVSALRHSGPENAAGRWLLHRLLNQLAVGDEPRTALSEEWWTAFKAKVAEERLDLSDRVWRFRPDPRDEGVAQGWALPDAAANTAWTDIRINSAWESQGYPALDGWAWYGIRVDVPGRWAGRGLYLTFEGVDDCYELYVDGELVAKRGDPAKRVSTFDEKYSHDLSGRAMAGKEIWIAVRVYDWYGAGGIFRPVTLSTAAYNPASETLR